jgi:hypothetical protein
MARHSRDCRICHHPAREAIEHAFVSWESPSAIAKSYRLNRSTLYLHARALGLLDARDKNVRAALSKFIERCHRVRPTASAFVSAVVALSKFDKEGHTVDRIAVSKPTEFVGWTSGELESFAAQGIVPDRFRAQMAETKGASTSPVQ